MAVSTSENDALHKRSGEVMDDDPLVRFLYLLMRDHLPTGVVEGLVHSEDKVIHFTNGFLARYAQDMAARLAGRVPPTSG